MWSRLSSADRYLIFSLTFFILDILFERSRCSTTASSQKCAELSFSNAVQHLQSLQNEFPTIIYQGSSFTVQFIPSKPLKMTEPPCGIAFSLVD